MCARIFMNRITLSCLLALWLGACGLSDTGHQTAHAPQAVATVIGQSFTRDSSGTVSTTVRSQSEVFLSGKDSEAGDKPILSFQWTPIGSPPVAVKLVKRSNSTWSFTAPTVATTTSLSFRLTIADSDGRTSNSTVNVQVLPVLDSDHFLYPEATSSRAYESDIFSVVVMPTSSITAAANGPDIPFELVLRKKLAYRKRGDSPTPATPTGLADLGIIKTIQGKWIGKAGSPGADPTAYQNPRYSFRIPPLNADEINFLLQDAAASSATRDDQLDEADIDDANVLIEISARPLSSARGVRIAVIGGWGFQQDFSSSNPNTRHGVLVDHLGAAMQANNDGSTAAATLTVRTEDLRTALLDSDYNRFSRSSANAYYTAIDPNNRRTTLSDWLYVNCFDATKADYDASGTKGAHAIYTNNFDLGFGRDMYMRTATCGAGTVNKPREFINGDVASVVINYPSVEAAAKKTGAVIAVAMEYRALDTANNCVGNNPCVRTATFYVFAPDEKTGDFRRITSANFDGRGEKTVPTACIECHGKGPNLLDSNGQTLAAGGAFMPFDLKTLIFTDTDPAFSTDPIDSGLKQKYSKSSQLAEITKLNQAVLTTFADVPYPNSPGNFLRQFAAARELVNGWLQSGENYIPPEWKDGANYATAWNFTDPNGNSEESITNPVGTESLYLNVISKHCRACHMQQNPSTALSFQSYGNFIGYESGLDSSTSTVQRLISTHVYDIGDMPGARLTMDRFWTADSSGQSPATQLANHLATAVNASPRVSVPITAPTAPGAPMLTPSDTTKVFMDAWRFDQQFEVQLDTPDISQPLKRNAKPGPIWLDARYAVFYSSLQWSVCRGVSAVPCPVANIAPLVGAESAQPAFSASQVGTYYVHVTATDNFNRSATATMEIAVAP